jgi:RimJ/RimL family protein N-acetyltransferase
MTINAASRRVLEKCGLSYVRTFNQPPPEPFQGSQFGAVEYELLRSDWIPRQE